MCLPSHMQFKKADVGTVLSTAAAITTDPAQAAGAALQAAVPAGTPNAGAAQQSVLVGLMLAGYQLLGELVRRREGGADASGIRS